MGILSLTEVEVTGQFMVYLSGQEETVHFLPL